MNTEPNKTPRPETRQVLEALCKSPSRLVRMLCHNWPWKLLALFLALCLWAGLISQDATLTRERTFTDVPLSVSGADSLRRNSGLIVLSGLESESLNVRMRVEVPQKEYMNVTYSYYNPRIDLTRITEPGEQTLKISTTTTNTYGSVVDISPATVTLVVDEYVTNYRVPVSVNVTGEYPDGFYGGTFSRDPSVVAVSGPRTIVDQIARVYVDFDASMLSARAGELRTALPMRFVDREGNDVQSDLIEVSSAGVLLRTITLEQTLYPMRDIPLSAANLVSGEPAHGYRVGNVSISPAALRAAGEEDALSTVEQLFIDSAVDVSGATESFTQNVRVRKPSELEYMSSETVTVSVEIEPVVISRTFDSVKLFARGTGSGLNAGLDCKTLSAVLTGPQLLLESLRAANVTAYVDVTDLEEGEYELPVEIRIEGGSMEGVSFLTTPATVLVTLSRK